MTESGALTLGLGDMIYCKMIEISPLVEILHCHYTVVSVSLINGCNFILHAESVVVQNTYNSLHKLANWQDRSLSSGYKAQKLLIIEELFFAHIFQ